MNKILSDANKKLHKNIKSDNVPFVLRERHSMLHVCIGSSGCNFKKSGCCVMCNYGHSSLICENEVSSLFSIIKQKESDFTSILIGTYGSLFDINEIPPKIFTKILKSLNEIDIKTVIFETHYSTVSNEKLREIRSILSDKEIVIELGLESSNQFVLNESLNKQIDLIEFKRIITTIHKFNNMYVSANVFLGAPFLTPLEQIEDSLQTIIWAVKNGVDNVVVFPANIRKNTLIEYLYRHGRYDELSNWSLFELLLRIPVEYQSKVYLSWFGDWDDEKIINNSNAASEQLFGDLFDKYLCTANGLKRKELLGNFLNDVTLKKLYIEFHKKVLQKHDIDLKTRLAHEHHWINQKLNMN